MGPPGYSTSILQVFIICEVFTSKVLLHFWKQKNVRRCQVLTTEDARRCPNGFAHVARLVSTRQYADVHCRETEQFHARACLFAKRTWDLIACRKRITPRTSQSAVFSIGTVMVTAISALTTRQGPTYNCMREVFNITLNPRNQWSAATKQILSGWLSGHVEKFPHAVVRQVP